MSSEEKTRIRSDAADPMVGMQLSGIYELDEHIASGGMGEVYRGHNIQTGDAVAIKLMRPEFSREQTMLGLFRKEASILNHLSHEAIIRYHVFTVDQATGRPYLAMEFVRGISLVDLMRRGPLPAGDVRKLCHRLASGLSAVHEAGAVHRDLSPDNIILPDGRVERAKIIDFGIAKSATVGGETLIGSGFAGKYNYVSPEQLGLYGGEVTAQSDIYSLGLVLVAALRGRPLDMGGSQLEILQKRRTLPDLSGLDPTLMAIIEAMLQPNPKDRPPSMAEIAWVTRETTFSSSERTGGSLPPSEPLERQPVRPAVADEPSFVPHVPPAHLSRPRPTAPAPPVVLAGSTPRARAGRDTGILLAAAAAIAVAAGLGVYFYTSRDTAPEPTKLVAPPSAPEMPPSIAQGGDARNDEASPAPTQFSENQDDTESAVNFPEPAAERLAVAPDAASEADAPSMDQPSPRGSETSLPAKPSAQPAERPAPADDNDSSLAMNVPRPMVPPSEAIDEAAQRISWLRNYQGGECFYATATAMTDKAVEIEGFGTSVEPFEKLMIAFQAEFRLEPDISVRLIRAPQCEVVDLLRDLPSDAAERPELALERTVIPAGASLSGNLNGSSGSKYTLLLVDHDGMTFDVTGRLGQTADKSAFDIPLLLDAGRLAEDSEPQILVAIGGREPVQAAMLTKPTPAAVVFPAISAEIRERGMRVSATAKYFRLGG